MTQTHPITPPDELLEHWRVVGNLGNWQNALTLAYHAGADQELEACCQWLFENDYDVAPVCLRAARRLKPPSLKEQALKMLRPLSNPVMTGTPEYRLYEPQAEIIRRALEALDD